MIYIKKLKLFFYILIQKIYRFFLSRKALDHVSWYEAKPATFNIKVGHEDFRKVNYREGFKKYAIKEDIKYREDFDKGIVSDICIFLAGGLGDNIQFLRFVKIVKEKFNSHISVIVTKKYLPLCEILERLEYIDQICLKTEDCKSKIKISIQSLPYLLDFGLWDLPNERYLDLKLPVNLLSEIKEEITNDKFKIGIHWSTGKNPGQIGENNRSINIKYFEFLINKNIKLYSLEKNNNKLSKDLLIKQLGHTRNLLKTYLIIRQMDLVITTDTSIAHLAGAIGVETWIILPHPCSSWRWYTNEHSTPWYPSVRLIRQDYKKKWSTVLQKINFMLNEKLSKF